MDTSKQKCAASNETQNGNSENNLVYAVVIDAGSTGSRVVGYKFQKQGNDLKLLGEEFHKQRPGLSSYANDPELGAKKIMDLLNQANNFVPDHKKTETILYLRATAGLRLLGEEVAQKLLQAVQRQFEKTLYKVEQNAAGLLSGTDEGIFAWFAVNYFKETLDKRTYAALEMGGGSAQVTYVPQYKYVNFLKKDIHPVPYKNLKVFSKSFLGLGLNAARDTMFQADSWNKIEEGQNVFSRCFLPQIKNVEFEFNNKKYYISGKPGDTRNNRPNMYSCRYYVIKYILPKIQPKPLGLCEEDSVALSAFYYRGRAAELIVGPSGKICLGDLWRKTDMECAKPNEKDPFLCMDMIYMYTLLKNGYGLRDTNYLEMILNIDNHELSWALGFAYSKLIEKIQN
ncbi:ectonucleoside triphosphate diphosphohydrolase 5-like [Ctenocephalides felis]|uniref:ectonucleoside triphosphate diphosphohydrolase 5-like n=1 Tax=Ctenocephalides felis TaxID=7515 RepID=UPI000E6E3F78|nr:ectonucleoside triphosphate diphosphohydrolase 5-like [Ctenocephalides felis]